VTETDWTDTLRKPLVETNASLSALEYVHWLAEMWGGDGNGTAGRGVDDGDGGDNDGGEAAGEGSGADARAAGGEDDDTTTRASTDGGSTDPDTQQSPVEETDPQQSALSGFASPVPDSTQLSEDEE
jgi:hypothetical protein